MRPYLEILRIPGALKFSSAGLLARSGGAMMGIGLVLMVSGLYGSYELAGALAAANGAAWAIGTAVLSNLVDRYGQRRVMLPAVVASSIALALMVVFAVLQLPVWALFPPAIISGATGGAPGALVRARWSHITDDAHQLHTAFSLESSLDELTFVIGPVVATALATTVHPASGLVLPVVLSLIGAWLFYSQRATEPPVLPRVQAPSGQPALQRLVLAIPGVGPVIAANLLIGAVFGSIDITVVAATSSWDARAASGIVLGVFSLASAIAGLYYGSRHWNWSLPVRFVVGFAALMVAAWGLLLANSVVTLTAVGVAIGLTIAPTLTNGNSLIGRLAPAERLTEGLAWMGTGIGIGAAFGSSFAGQAIDNAGYHAGFVVVAVCASLAALIALVSFRVLTRVTRPAEESLPTVA
ncbi:MAG: MFS transporter [Propionicimonas sp.]|nr:MFS transporter [Propionicimonas sp.]